MPVGEDLVASSTPNSSFEAPKARATLVASTETTRSALGRLGGSRSFFGATLMTRVGDQELQALRPTRERTL